MPFRVSLDVARRQETRPHGWERQQLPDELGACLTDSLRIRSDFSVLHTCYRPRDDLVEESIKRQEQPVLAITLGIAGESAFRARCGTELHFRRGHTTVSTFHSIEGERHYRGENDVRQLRLLIGAEALDYYLGESARKQLLDGKANLRPLAQRPTTGASLVLVKALLRETEQDTPDKLQTDIHVLSLLAEQLRHLDLARPERRPRHCQRDIKRFDEARTILESCLERAPTIAELAATVGLNESKLREGFRQRFQKSPHRMLTEARMKKAWQLLEAGCQVAEAAYAVGYEHPSNFSSAFSRFFGCAPKSVFGPKY